MATNVKENIIISRINTIIEMYGMEDVITVRECTDDKPADRYVGGQVVYKGYQVNHKIHDNDYNVYVCRTMDSAAQCVNRIIFDLPIDVTSTDAPVTAAFIASIDSFANCFCFRLTSMRF